jgi:7-carboxy-7-deazaguanine synthase
MNPSLIIAEEFVSIQGEGALVGMPSYFVRVTGCPLRCAWCDEPGTSWRPVGEPRSVADIMARILASGLRHVVLTGGEPFSQTASVTLAAAVRAAGLHLTIETSGAVERPGLVCDLLSLSPKLAHSTPKRRGENLADRHNRLRYNPELLHRLITSAAGDWQIKAVVRAGNDKDISELLALLGDARVSDMSRVFLVPEGVDAAALDAGLKTLAPVCMTYGFRLGHRLHLSLYGNTPGT